MLTLGLFALWGFVFTALATGVTLKVLRHYHIMDNPTARGSHTIPTPRGGGWGVMIPLLGLMALAAYATGAWEIMGFVATGIVVLMVVSWMDDTRSMSAKARFGVQILAVVLGYQALPDNQILPFLPEWLEYAVVGIGWLWFINLYNFMDGIDGITGQETAFIGLGVALITLGAMPGDTLSPLLGASLLGCGLGFLVWNWHPAKLFMGDIGSVPLGFVGGFLLLTLAAHGQLFAALIIPLYYIGDATYTIIKRALKGEKIWEAHRQHFYQISLPVVNKMHDKTVRRIIVCNLVLLLCAYAAVWHGWVALIPAAATVTALFLVLRQQGILARRALQQP